MHTLKKNSQSFFAKLKYFAYFSPALRIWEIINYITLGIFTSGLETSTRFYVLLSIGAIFAIIGAFFIHRVDGKDTSIVLSDYKTIYEELDDNQKAEVDKINNIDTSLVMLLLVDICSITAASINIFEETIHNDDAGDLFDDNNDTILFIIFAILTLAFLSKISNTLILQKRNKFEKAIELYFEFDSTQDINEDYYNLIDFNEPKEEVEKNNTGIIVSLSVSSLLTFLFCIWFPVSFSFLPTWAHILAGFSTFAILMCLSSVISKKLLLKVSNDNSNFSKEKKLVYTRITEYNDDKKLAANKFMKAWNLSDKISESKKFYVFGVIPLYNFISIAFPVFYSSYYLSEYLELPTFYESSVSAIITIAITMVIATFYAINKQRGQRLDRMIHAAKSAYEFRNSENAVNLPQSGNNPIITKDQVYDR